MPPRPHRGLAYDTSRRRQQALPGRLCRAPGVKKLPDGLMYRVIKAGDGAPVQKDSDMVTVYYKGSLINGKVFDQTKPEEPAQFPAGGLIPGWVEALKLMKTGDTWELVVPPTWAMAATAPATTFRPTRPWSSP